MASAWGWRAHQRPPVQSGWTSVLASCLDDRGSLDHVAAQEPRAVEHHRVSRLAENNTSPNRLRPRQVGRVEARAEQSLGLADALKGSHDVQREGHDTIVVVFAKSRF